MARTTSTDGCSPSCTKARTKATSNGLLGLGSHRTLNNSCSKALAVVSESAAGSAAAAVVVAVGAASATTVLTGIDECVGRCHGRASISRPKGRTLRGVLGGMANASAPLDPFRLLRRNTAIVHRRKQCNTHTRVGLSCVLLLCFRQLTRSHAQTAVGNQNAVHELEHLIQKHAML